jgi:hypothetical protein
MGDIILSGAGGSSSGGGGPIQDGVNPTIEATVFDLTDSNPLAVQIVDANGDAITSFGGGTQYAEDTPSTAGEIVTMAGVIRQDVPATLVNTDLDRTELTVDNKNRLWVNGSDVTQPISAASLPLPIGAATSALQTQPGVDIGDVTVNNGAGAAAVNIQDGGNSITVDGAVTANAGTNLNTSALALSATQIDGTQKSIVRGGAKGATTAADITSTNQSADRQALDVQIRTSTGAVVDTFGGGTQYTEDVPAAADPTGTMPVMVRADTPALVTSTDGDNIAQRATNYGAAYVQLVTSAGAFINSFGGSTPPSTVTATQVNPAWRQSITLLAANASRKEGMLVNQTDAPFYLMEGLAASDITYVAVIPPRARYTFDSTVVMNGWWNINPTSGTVTAVERT